MKKRKIILVVHNVRSAHNVGSLLRSADGLGLEQVYLSGYTPYPAAPNDERLPHVQQRAEKLIHKTALGAEKTVKWTHIGGLTALKDSLKQQDYLVVALEQVAGSKSLADFRSDQNVALLVGNEIKGLDGTALKMADITLQIPMLGTKESFNVSSAAAMALYHLRYQS